MSQLPTYPRLTPDGWVSVRFQAIVELARSDREAGVAIGEAVRQDSELDQQIAAQVGCGSEACAGAATLASPMVDMAQQDRFFRAAEDLGYRPAALFLMHSSAMTGVDPVHTVTISRQGERRSYYPGRNGNWVDEAIKGLREGLFGPPDIPAQR